MIIYISTLYRHENLSGSEASDFSAWVCYVCYMTCTELDRAQAPPRLASDFAASTNSNHRTGDGSLYLAVGDLSFRRQNVFAGESFQSWKIMGVYIARLKRTTVAA
jgi:hypothetical protein